MAGHNATALRPLVDSGQVALGNHTWSHLALMTLGDREVAEEIRRDRDFLRSDLGVRDDPFFRPPFGARTPRVLAGAHGRGGEWFAAQRIVVGHVNRAAVTTVYGDLPALTVSVDLRPAAFSDRLSETATERGRRGRWRTPVP